MGTHQARAGFGFGGFGFSAVLFLWAAAPTFDDTRLALQELFTRFQTAVEQLDTEKDMRKAWRKAWAHPEKLTVSDVLGCSLHVHGRKWCRSATT